MQADTQADLFGAPSAPRQTLPLPGTQARRVLERLATGEQIDHAGWYHATGSWRLAAHVGRLMRDFGWPVQKTMVASPTRPCPGRLIARYWLCRDDRMHASSALRQAGRPETPRGQHDTAPTP
jgi:hypothetical protein